MPGQCWAGKGYAAVIGNCPAWVGRRGQSNSSQTLHSSTTSLKNFPAMRFGASELNVLGGRGLCPSQGAPWLPVELWAEVLAGHTLKCHLSKALAHFALAPLDFPTSCSESCNLTTDLSAFTNGIKIQAVFQQPTLVSPAPPLFNPAIPKLGLAPARVWIRVCRMPAAVFKSQLSSAQLTRLPVPLPFV